MQATQNQISLANELGIKADPDSPVDSLIQGIEQALGDSRLREMCRWFVLSAYRYQQRGHWSHPGECDLARESQYELAQAYLDSRDGKAALQAVLRDPRFRFTLVQFGKKRDPISLTLSSGTKAFRRALQVISQFGEQSRSEPVQRLAKPRRAEGLVVDRRARRRGFSIPDGDDALPPLDSIRVASRPVSESALNEAEYQALEQQLEDATPAEDRSFSYRSNEDKISLVLGMASGLVLFLLVLLVLS